MTIQETFEKLSNDLKEWIRVNLDRLVPKTRQINKYTLDKDINLAANDVGAYSTTEIDNKITVLEDADKELSDRIDAEVTALEDADKELSDRIDAEVTARENADTDLNNKITTIEGNITIIQNNNPYKIEVVNSLPATQKDDTIYFVKTSS